MAAKAISEKALNRASKKTSYQSPLKRKPLEAGNPSEVSSSETKTSVAPLSKRSKKLRDEDDEFFSTLNEESGATKTKSSRRERYIACLASDIVECDPQRAGREDLFSKWYINKVKEKLGDSSAEYEAFLQALMTFGKEKKNPAVFYEELRSTILKGHDELLDGFSAFLLPAQALACGVKCYKTCSQFHQARKFLRKLEVYFGGATKTFQKLIKLLSSGSSQNAASVTTSDIRDSITAILKGHPALLKDFTSFFPDAAPAKRNEEDYEEMDLTEYDEDTVIDMFEEMEVPEVDVTIATPDCKCTCHSDEKKPKAYKLCAMHCVNCRVTVLQNRLHIHAGPRKGLRPAYYRYLDPLPSQLKKEEDDDTTDPHSTSNDEGITLGTDTKELAPPLSLPSQPVVAPWTRAEDEILLKTLKTEAMESGESFSLNDKTVTQLASQLQNRETNEIKQRLETLLQLLSQDVDEETSHSGL